MPGAKSVFFNQSGTLGDQILKVARDLEFKRGEYIYRAGEATQGIYWVRSGLIGLVIIGPSGKEHLMRFFTSNQTFGHRSLFAGQNYHASTQALELTKVQFIAKENIQSLLKEYPELYTLVLKQMAIELCNCELQQVSILDQQILPRVARAIVFLKDVRPDYRWTRSELASFVASTTSTVIKALAELEYLGLIKQKGRDIHIVDRSGLINFQTP
jgi:CRP-like cAMP-binding protein